MAVQFMGMRVVVIGLERREARDLKLQQGRREGVG